MTRNETPVSRGDHPEPPTGRRGRRWSGATLVRQIGRAEWPILLGCLFAAGAMWLFIELADEVAEGSTHALDRMILLAMRSESDPADPLGPPWLEEMMRDLTALGGVGVLLLVTAGAVGYLLLTDKSHAAIAVLLSIGGGLLLSTFMKLGFDRPRPDLVPLGSYVYTASFPSGHSMMAAVVYLSLGALLARVRPHLRVKVYVLGSALVLTLLVGISRIYLGVHWPTDVLAGWAVGAAWALLCWAATLWLQSRGKVELDRFGSGASVAPSPPVNPTADRQVPGSPARPSCGGTRGGTAG